LIPYYGLIASILFSTSYSTFGVFAGDFSSKVNRKVLLGLSCILWSATSLGVGLVNSFFVFCLMRFLLGVFCSSIGPANYSLIADYFPPSYRSTANAIENAGVYVGAGLSSLCVILIGMFGWRGMYMVCGSIGVVLGLLTLVLVKEPKRGVFDLAT
jgi:MFS family permease